MVEMIVEKQMFAAKDLKNLFQCFLSLNSYHHHRVIIEVYTEIWERDRRHLPATRTHLRRPTLLRRPPPLLRPAKFGCYLGHPRAQKCFRCSLITIADRRSV
uniref:Transcription repressor n=1 Tax=Davidia involucrata TaxID=16924 RepID=A0A5B7BVY5_DAVIN